MSRHLKLSVLSQGFKLYSVYLCLSLTLEYDFMVLTYGVRTSVLQMHELEQGAVAQQ